MNESKRKRSFCIALVSLIAAYSLMSQDSSSSIVQLDAEQPSALTGSYYDGQRIIIFSGDKAGSQILKPYYGWYYDAYYEMENFPSAVNPLSLNGGIYTQYWERTDSGNRDGTAYWRPCTNTQRITINPALIKKELYGFITSNDYLYRIRYWQVSVPYTDQKVLVHDPDNDGLHYEIDKYIAVGSVVYTCVNGRGTVVRNVEKEAISQSHTLGFTDVYLTSDGRYAVMGEPDYKSFEHNDLDAFIKEQNSKRKPPRKPPFEYMDLDFYYDEIERLRK